MSKKKEKKPEENVKQDAEKNADEASIAEEGMELSGELEAALAEVESLKEKLIRAHADMDNLRKRTQREVDDARKFAVEKFAVALLDVVDNLERALAVDEGNEEALRQGVQLTFDSWHGMMKHFEMERIDAVGNAFDPHLHEALSQMPSDEPEGTVIAQHVAGYALHGRLIRPARVLVSSGPAK